MDRSKTTGVWIALSIFLLHIPFVTATGNPPIRIVEAKGLIVKLDLSTQILNVETEDDYNPGQYILPTLQSLRIDHDNFISLGALMVKTKQFNDGLLATVELLCQEGNERFPGRKKIIAALFKSLSEQQAIAGPTATAACQARILAAARLGGIPLVASPRVQQSAGEIIRKLAVDPSQPLKAIGFYSWSPQLGMIFQQDRLLQQPLIDTKQIMTLAGAIARDNQLLETYGRYLAFFQRLFNPRPPEYCDLSGLQQPEKDIIYCIFPPARSPEIELFKRTGFRVKDAHAFSLIDEMIQKIQRGEMTLEPTKDSGWYDHQAYALEPLLIPEQMAEGKKLSLGSQYKEDLVTLFKTAMALQREGFIRGVEGGTIGGTLTEIPVIEILPDLSVDPIASFYLRQARSYGFIKDVLLAAFGEETLKKCRRLQESGESSVDLWRELQQMEEMFYGLYQVSGDEIGLPADESSDASVPDAAKQSAREWLKSLQTDPEMETDMRVMVPVYYDAKKHLTKVWAFLGFTKKKVFISYRKFPQATVTDRDGNAAQAKLEFESELKNWISPVCIETYVKRVLDRKEFRRLCDNNTTRAQIEKALKNL